MADHESVRTSELSAGGLPFICLSVSNSDFAGPGFLLSFFSDGESEGHEDICINKPAFSLSHYSDLLFFFFNLAERMDGYTGIVYLPDCNYFSSFFCAVFWGLGRQI